MIPIEAENRSREQLLALYEISKAVNSTLELDDVLDHILAMTLEHFTGEAGSIMLLDESSQMLRIAVARGLAPDIVEKTAVRVGEGIAGWVARTGETVQLDGKVTDPRFTGLVSRSDSITSALCSPLKYRGRCTGVLMIRRGVLAVFAPDQLEFFGAVADLCALALENARLYRADRLERQKLGAILASMADGVIVCDPAGTIRHSDAAAARMVELSVSLPETLPALPFDQMAQHLQTDGSYERTFNLARGQVVRLLATPLGRGELEGVVCVLQDETERERVERMKSEFLSMVSHELKTPITTIQAFQELLLFRDFPPERQKRFHQICYDESVRLQKLIEAILDLSRLEAGTFAFQRVPGRFDDILSSVLPGFLEQPGHSFEVEIDPDTPEFNFDPTLMAQAVQNLVSNAVKYTPPGKKIRVTLRREPSRLVFGVQDEGIGIPKDKIPLVFEKFFRADNSLTRAQGGTGLGLANARYIVEGHGGSIWVESEVGRGSHFQFSLPV